MLVDHLPEVLLINVLLRLSVESLVRLRCVCRSLHDLISSQSFKEEHYRNTAPVILLERRDFRKEFRYRADCEFSISFVDDHVERVMVDFPFRGKLPSLVGTCDGIVCLYFHLTGEFALWNPALREYKVLPGIYDTRPSKLHFGFGYDATSNDYKVVRFFARHCEGPIDTIDDVEVCTQTASSWRKHHVSNPVYFNYLSRGAYAHGSCHWIAPLLYENLGATMKMFIVSIDMSDEKLHRVSLPSGINSNGSALLMVLKESLAIICTSLDQQERMYHVWIRNGDHISGSWTRRHIVPMTVQLRAMPLMSWKNVECMGNRHRNPTFYDFVRGERVSVEELSEPSALTVGYSLKYRESLFSIKL